MENKAKRKEKVNDNSLSPAQWNALTEQMLRLALDITRIEEKSEPVSRELVAHA